MELRMPPTREGSHRPEEPIGKLPDHDPRERPGITVFSTTYPPVNFGPGPARSVYGLVEAVGSEFRFSVVASAIERSANGQASSVKPRRWNPFGRAVVWFDPRRRMPARTVDKLLSETQPDLIYLNSLLNYRFSILPLIIGRTKFRRVPMLLAPRGELAVGALALKRRKKQVFIAGFRLMRLHKSITWHASTQAERADIERVFGQSIKCHVAIDLRTGLIDEMTERDSSQSLPDSADSASLVLLSRIVPIKNIETAIKAMEFVKSSAQLTIAGPIEDAVYWNRCLELIKDLPEPGLIRYAGAIPPEAVVDFLHRFELFVFPTVGENFGHVVLESLAAGTPIIIGGNTPWDRIEKSGAGLLCDTTDPEAIAERIDYFLSLETDARNRMRNAARSLALEVLTDPIGLDANRSMLRAVITVEST